MILPIEREIRCEYLSQKKCEEMEGQILGLKTIAQIYTYIGISILAVEFFLYFIWCIKDSRKYCVLAIKIQVFFTGVTFIFASIFSAFFDNFVKWIYEEILGKTPSQNVFLTQFCMYLAILAVSLLLNLYFFRIAIRFEN